ncbi:MAG: DUF177 domain-containing protein [Candidatus Omnitrophota bacterium]
MKKTMKINILDVNTFGLELKEDVNAQKADVETDFVHYLELLHIVVNAVNVQNTVTLVIETRSVQELVCHRCLGAYQQDLDKKITLTYPANKNITVDILSHVRDEIILSYPLRLLCQKDCAGICASCGANLNKVKCECENKQ